MVQRKLPVLLTVKLRWIVWIVEGVDGVIG